MPIQDKPLTNKQHAVPQNFMDVEFKLIGDLTMRQFSYLVVFGLLAYFSFVTVGGVFKIPLGIIFAITGLAFAFVPIQERGLDEWVVSFIRAVYTPNIKIWKKEPTLPEVFAFSSLDIVRQEMVTLAPTSSRRKLEEYLEYGIKKEEVDPLDIPEKSFIKMVRDAYISFAPAAVQPMQPQAGVTTTVIEPPLSPTPTPTLEPTPVVGPSLEVPQPVVEKPIPPKPIPEHVVLSQITPDRSPGRVFTSLLPSQGDLILPIRGERVLRTEDQIDIDADIDSKREDLEKLIKNIKQSEGIKSVQKTTPKEEVSVDYESIQKEISNLQGRLKEEDQKPQVAVNAQKPTYASIAPITNKPDTISGLVKSSVGAPLESLIIIIKNLHGEAVRAVKTNSLGQFSLSTPLPNGVYTVEVSQNNSTGLTFDIISIEIKGGVLPPIVIEGH